MLKSIRKLILSVLMGVIVFGVLINTSVLSAAEYTKSASGNVSVTGVTLKLTSKAIYKTASATRWAFESSAEKVSGNITTCSSATVNKSFSASGTIEKAEHTIKGTFTQMYQQISTPSIKFKWAFDYNNTGKGVYLE